MKKKVLVSGASGRMGKLLVNEILNSDFLQLTGALVGEGSRHLNKNVSDEIELLYSDKYDDLLKISDVVIDFSNPIALNRIINLAFNDNKKRVYIIGTTGLSEELLLRIEALSTNNVVVVSGNMGFGIKTVEILLEHLISLLGDEKYDINIIESHHKNKIDAPSGTSILLENAINRTNIKYGNKIKHASIRGGDIVGEHTVKLISENEEIQIKHIADNRNVFSKGTMKAVKWALKKEKGLYTIKDVVLG